MQQEITTEVLELNRQQAFNWQQRRHEHWTENYDLYRDKVQTNRLLQRQSVNIPLIKETIRTLIAKVKKMPDLRFEEKETPRINGIPDKQKEMLKNEAWLETVRKCRLKQKDTVNKKQVLLYGRSFWKMGIADGEFWAEVIDPQDILIDRYADPADIEGTANFFIHQHIYRTIDQLESRAEYDKAAISRIKLKYAQSKGLVTNTDTSASRADSAQRMDDMGVPDTALPALGQTTVELMEHYVRVNRDGNTWLLIVTADGEKLMDKPVKETSIGVDFLPIVTWAEDLERSDIWSDSVADIIRTINRVLNAWFSQWIENRTLRNFGMNYYDATADPEWRPSAMNPVPFGWYPLPGKPGEVFQKVDIEDLDGAVEGIDFLIQLAQRASAATATQQGQSEKNQITLGEVKLLLSESEDRIADMSEPHEQSWLEFGEKWSAIVDANADLLKPYQLSKKSNTGNAFSQEVKATDWKSDSGYNCVIRTRADQEKEQFNWMQKALAVKAQMPMNMPLARIIDEKMVTLLDLSSEQEEEVLQYQQEIMQALAAAPAAVPPGAPASPVTPQPNAISAVAA